MIRSLLTAAVLSAFLFLFFRVHLTSVHFFVLCLIAGFTWAALEDIFSPKEKAFELILPEGFDPEEAARLHEKLSEKTTPNFQASSLEEYLRDKLLPYMVIRLRFLGFPVGTKIILRGGSQEYTEQL